MEYGLPMADIARRTGVTTSAVSKTLKNIADIRARVLMFGDAEKCDSPVDSVEHEAGFLPFGARVIYPTATST
jgi:hypothetical protein